MVSFLLASRTSLATFHEGKHNISHMSMDVARGLMVTCGTDRIVKVTCLFVPVSISAAWSLVTVSGHGTFPSPVSPSDWHACQFPSPGPGLIPSARAWHPTVWGGARGCSSPASVAPLPADAPCPLGRSFLAVRGDLALFFVKSLGGQHRNWKSLFCT